MTDAFILTQPAPFAVPAGLPGMPGAKGDPGANVMAVGLFTALSAISVPLGTTLIQTSGHGAAGRGPALLIEDTTLTDADVAAHPNTIGKSNNGRYFRLAPDQVWHLPMFGVIGDGNVANASTNFAALEAMKSYVAKYPRTGVGYGTAGHSIWWGFNDVHIGANTFDITDVELRFLGESGGGTAAGASIIRTTGTTAVRVQNADTTGASGTRSVTSATGAGSNITGLTAAGDYVSGAESEAHGFHIRGKVTLTDCSAYGFAGDGFHLVGNSGGPEKGNVNGSLLVNCFAQGNRHGFFLDGDDANACSIIRCNANGNRAWGFWDSSFLGNTFTACEAAANGWDGAASSIPTACTYSSKRYYVKAGQATWCKTNPPTGTTDDNQGWGYIGAGGTFNGIAAWVSGTDFREGGDYKTDNANGPSTFIGCYSEGDQNPPQIIAPSIIQGGFLALRSASTALNIRSDTSGSLIVGPSRGIVDGQSIFTYTNSGHFLQGRFIASDGTITDMGRFGFFGTAQLFYQLFNAGGAHRFIVGSTEVDITAAGVALASGQTITVNGIQVLGARQTGLPADATDLASVIALANSMKAKGAAAGFWS